MTRVPFTVIYFDKKKNNIKRKRCKGCHVQLVVKEFQEKYPDCVVIAAGIADFFNISDQELQEIYKLKTEQND